MLLLAVGCACLGRAAAHIHTLPPVQSPPPGPCAGDSNGAVTSSATFPAFPAPNLLPWPQKIALSAGYFYPNATTLILLNGNDTTLALLRPAGELLAQELSLATGGALSPRVQVEEGHYVPGPHVHLFLTPAEFSGRTALEGSSSTRIAAHGAVLSADSYVGMMSATATLLQALEKGADTDGRREPKCMSGEGGGGGSGGGSGGGGRSWWRWPVMDVEDGPAFGIRGVMVDAARSYLPLAQLKQYVVLCRLYKLNHFHIHLSDDGSFTFPSTKYPQLAAKAKFKYTLNELQELQAYAAARGVTIIGEMDVPGHASGLTAVLPDVFAFKSQPSLGVVNFVNSDTVKALQTIFDEIQAVFPSRYTMMGGDEVNLKALEGLPEIQAAAKKLGGNASSYDLYRSFIAEMHAYANASGRELIVWEGFAPKTGQTGRSAHAASAVDIPTDVIVTPFDCFYYPPPQLARDGYRIINAAWTPLYIAGGSGQSPELIYSWNPWLLGEFPGHVSWWTIPKENHPQVIGVKMAVWSTSANDTLCALSGRLPAMSDRSWNPQAARTYADYQVRVAATSQLLAALLGRSGASPAPGPPPTPKPLPRPAAPGFVGHAGECRDKDGGFGTRLEHNGPINIADCEAMCTHVGQRCDAYDWGNGAWCGIWGTTFVQADNTTFGGKHWTWAGGSDASKNEPVCQADAKSTNVCYHRVRLDCTHAPSAQTQPVGCLAGCDAAKQCWKGGI